MFRPMALAACSRNEIFAANRALGRVALEVTAARGKSRPARVHEAGSLRVRFPNTASAATLDAVIVNTAGGMTGGDRFDIDIAVGAGAHLTITTAAAEKVYRSLGPQATIGVKLTVGAGGTLAWLPRETILFDRVRLHRTVDVDLIPGANLVLAEAVIFGRSAMGETVVSGDFFDQWRVRMDGKLAFAETLHLDGPIAQRLSETAAARAGHAIASVLKIPGEEATVAAVRAIEQNFAGEVGVSAWNGLMAARLVAPDGAALRHDLASALTAMGVTMPRLWLN